MTIVRNTRWVAGVAAFAIAAGSAHLAAAQDKAAEKPKPTASEATTVLKVGDPAPPLSISKWVKGEPISELQKGMGYVVEFWATWCPPCRESIPHLTELQKQHKGKVTIIGISGADSRGESLEKVEKFVNDKGDEMNYTVAFDKDRDTNTAYMKAAKQGGIPTAFVVNQERKIVWIGNPLYPMGEMDEVIAKVASGKSSVEEINAIHQKWEKKAQELEELEESLGRAMQARDADKALDIIEKLMKADPQAAGQLRFVKYNVLRDIKKDYTGAYKLADELASGPFKDDAMMLNQIAWGILDDEGVEKRDFDVAMRIAKRAVELTKEKDGAILDTLARAYFEKGDIDKAIEIQTKAVANINDERMREGIEEALEKYKKAKK